MRRPALTAVVALALCMTHHKASAQFYKPVVRLMGTVTRKDGTPVVVRVSVRDAVDTTKEIVSSTSNGATGKYLAIIQPAKSYLVLVQGDSLIPQSLKISTPDSDHNEQIVQDFTVQFVQPAHAKSARTAKAKKPVKKSAKKKK